MTAIETVLATLARGPKTAKGIREATGLPRRTIYSAISELRDNGQLRERANLQDTRQNWYWLA